MNFLPEHLEKTRILYYNKDNQKEFRKAKMPVAKFH